MLKKLRTSYLLPAELLAIANDYTAIFNESKINDPFVTRVLNFLSEGQTSMQQALTAVRQNTLITELSEADAVRDDLYIGFRDWIDANRRRHRPVIQEASDLVWPVIEQAGIKLYRLGYSEQSGRLDALFHTLDEGKYQAAMSRLQAINLYNELKEAQSNFTSLYQERIDADLLNDYPTLSEAKSKLAFRINALMITLEVLDDTSGEEHNELVSKINSVTSTYMTRGRARKTRADNETEPPITEEVKEA